MQIASEMLEEAVEEVEIEGKSGLAGDLYRQAIGESQQITADRLLFGKSYIYTYSV